MMRVLVVGDHRDTRNLLARNLEQASFDVKAAGSCEEAEAALVRGAFDVVILDVMLPDGSGIDLCRRLHWAALRVPVARAYGGDVSLDPVAGDQTTFRLTLPLVAWNEGLESTSSLLL